ncbi:MAG: TetR family transcriptional regulator [Actinomycetota bacterium]|nr:TetR family transcriptional regulator [Actinomycetota bacterium]
MAASNQPQAAPALQPMVRHRQPAALRRKMLVEAARSVIATRGLHATTLRDVAAAGDVAVGTVTYHFSGIAEVLAGVLEAEMQEYSAPIMAAAELAPTGRKALQHIVNGLLADGKRARDHWRLWLDFWALSAHDVQYARWQAAVYHELYAQVEHFIRRGRSDRSIGGDADEHTAAVEFVALLDGLVVQCYLPLAKLAPAAARTLLLAGLTRAAPPPAG